MNHANDNLTNAFRIVKQALDEASILMLDFDAEMISSESGFKSLHRGYEIGTESSNSLNVGEKWLKKYVMRYFLPKEQKNDFEYLLGVSIAYNFENHPSESPKIIIGIIRNNSQKFKSDYWWIPFLYDSEKLHKYTPEVESREDLQPNTWYKVDPSPSDNSKMHVFERGYLYFRDMLDINSREDVHELAEKLKSKFKEI